MAKAKIKDEVVDILTLPLQARVDILAKMINEAQKNTGVGIVLTMNYGQLRTEPEMKFSDLLKKDEETTTDKAAE